jgi:hypothetical protein
MSKNKLWYWVVSNESQHNAGLRVRTEPIISRLKRARFQFAITTPEKLMPLLESEVKSSVILGVVISKPGGSSYELLIKQLKDLNIPIVIDLFDNYYAYSSTALQRGIYWQWLSSLNSTDGVIVSTTALKDWINLLRTNLPLINVTDPLPWSQCFTTASIYDRWPILSNKWQPNNNARKLLWFGMPSNPWYRVGITDLLKWRDLIADLVDLNRERFNIELIICTKVCEEVAQAIGTFSSLGIVTKFVAWTEEACAAQLDVAHCVLLPAGKNAFSRAKTHNRLSDSINHGCLVLTNTEGPYEQLIGGAVIDNFDDLDAKLFGRNEQLVKKAIDQTLSNLNFNFNFNKQTTDLGVWLETIRLSKTDNQKANKAYSTLIVGREGTIGVVKQARKYGYLIAGYSGAGPIMTYDFFLSGINPEDCICELDVSEKVRLMLKNLGITDYYDNNTKKIGVKISDEYQPILTKIANFKQSGISIGELKNEFHSLSVYILGKIINNTGQMQLLMNTNSSSDWLGFVILNDHQLLTIAEKLQIAWKFDYA